MKSQPGSQVNTEDLYNTLISDTERSPVELGAELLDHIAPGWDDKIDLNRLNLKDYRHCILGQLFDSYTVGYDRLTEYLGLEEDEFDSFHFGFDAPGLADFRDLTEDWRNLIRDRLALALTDDELRFVDERPLPGESNE